jgi:lycopene beta-cyclase
MSENYDIIICGGGLAGLSLAYRAFSSGIWTDQRVLIIDQSKKDSNDRTWSFWEKSPGFFEEIIHHEWKQLIFYTNEHTRIVLDHLPYTYKTIRGLDFYNFVHGFLKQFDNIDWLEEAIVSTQSVADKCLIQTTSGSYTSKFAFNSIFKKPELKAGEQYFLQHFKGIRIKINSVQFNPDEAFLMDFRTSQENGTTFFYTLPLSEDEIFVEYTLFSKTLLEPAIYDRELAAYLNNILKLSTYEVIDQEFGVIPMTDHQFERSVGNITNIGTSGGDTRGSTGYTFTNVQRTITKILEAFKDTGAPFYIKEHIGFKENLYDATLLNVLSEGKYKGHQVFGDIFQGTDARTVFSFLDGESSLLEEIKVMKSLRTWPFFKWFNAVIGRRLKHKLL